MSTRSYLNNLAIEQLKDIRERGEALLTYLRSLDGYQWESLLFDICNDDPAAREIFVVRSDELVTAATAVMRNLSEQTKQLVAEALSRAIRSYLSNVVPASLANALHIAYATKLNVDAQLLLSVVHNTTHDLIVRRAALAALTITLTPPNIWTNIDTTAQPEFAPIVATKLATIAPLEGLKRLAGIERGVEVVTFRRAAQHILNKLERRDYPDIRVIIDGASEFARPALEALIQQEFLDRFGKAITSKVLSLVSRETASERQWETASEFYALVGKIQSRSWDVQHRYSGYYEGELFKLNVGSGQLPKPFLRLAKSTMRSIVEVAEQFQLPGSENIFLTPKPPGPMDSLVDEVFQLNIIQTDPIFGSAKRLARGSMVTIGQIRKLWLLVPKRYEDVVITSLAVGRQRRTAGVKVSRILRLCVEQPFYCIVQPSTAIEEELTEMLAQNAREKGEKRWTVRTSNPFDQISRPNTIRARLRETNLETDNTNYGALAVVDFLMAQEVREGAEREIIQIQAEMDRPLPVGYIIPNNDPIYRQVMVRAVEEALYNSKSKRWRNDFRDMMRRGSIELYEGGPRFLPMNSADIIRNSQDTRREAMRDENIA